MIDLIKKSVLAGLGAAVVTKETVEKSLQTLVAKGKLSAEDAGKTADSILEQGRAEFEKAKEELVKAFNQGLNKANVASLSHVEALEAEVKTLQARIAAIEALSTAPRQ